MTVTFGVTGADGSGNVNDGNSRVLATKTDSLSNVNNNNNVNISNNNNNNNNGPVTTTPSIADKTSLMSVRRVLFGPPDNPAQTRAWLDRQLCVAMAASSRSWNFDFANERPLPDHPADRYVWERVLPPQLGGGGQAAVSGPQQHKQDWRVIAADTDKQSKITDFMGKTKKRPLGVAGSLRSNKIAAAAAAADEQSGTNNNCKRTRRSVTAAMMAI